MRKSGASAARASVRERSRALASGLPTAARLIAVIRERTTERSVIFHDDVLNARQWFERSPGLTGGFQFHAS